MACNLIFSILLEVSWIWKLRNFSGSKVKIELRLELVSEELNNLAAILHVYAGGLNFMK